jgi:hypothetical protein
MRKESKAAPPSGSDADRFSETCTRAELLWRLYADNREYARSHEAQRSAAASLIIVISAGLLGLATSDRRLGLSDVPLTAFLGAVGAFGLVFSSKHYERTRLHLNRARQYLLRLDELFPEERIIALQERGDSVNREAFPRLSDIKLNWLWNTLYFAIATLGILLTVTICTRHWA